jgi:hypothetical protein
LSITRAKTSSIAQGPSTNRNLLAGNPVILPGSYESIATVTVGAGSSGTLTFSSIPQTYKHLQVRGIARCTFAANEAGVWFQFNGASTNYRSHWLYGNGTVAGSGESGAGQIAMQGLSVPAANAAANTFGPVVIDILDYADTNKNKTLRALGGYDRNGGGYINLQSGVWLSTSAVTSITLTSGTTNMIAGTTFSLYGIK